MEFGIDKCAMLVMEEGKIVKSIGIELPNGKVIKLLQEGKSYKYLGILEADKFEDDEYFEKREDGVECFEGIY